MRSEEMAKIKMKSEIFPTLPSSGICHGDSFITGDCLGDCTKTPFLSDVEHFLHFSNVLFGNNVICNLPSCDFRVVFLLSLEPPSSLIFMASISPVSPSLTHQVSKLFNHFPP